MTAPSASYSITVRMDVAARPGALSQVVSAIEGAGGLVSDVECAPSATPRRLAGVTWFASGPDEVDRVLAALRGLSDVRIDEVVDRTMAFHVGGKLSVELRTPIRNCEDLSIVYTPGVGRVSLHVAANPADARVYTIKGNTIAVVSDGTAVLGLGDLGPLGALPVMEGKAALFKRFADIDAFPLCLDTTDVDEIVATVRRVAPVFAGINLEDISAPRCFEVERRLRAELDIPVFHDDQHGTAIVTLAALRNALRVVGKRLEDVRIVQSGAGAAGSAVARLLLASGARDVVIANRGGVLHPGRTDLNSAQRWLAEHTNAAGRTGTLVEALAGADVFIGVSAANLLDEAAIATMAPRAIVFAMANPVPEVDPEAAARHAAVVATGRSDVPNQINNVLAFPGVFRGLLDAHSRRITDAMLVAAAEALAAVVTPEELSPTYIVPSVFHPDVTPAVARAVQAAAEAAEREAQVAAALEAAGGSTSPAAEARPTGG